MRFVLVDRVVELVSGERAVGIKNVTFSEDFFTHHFPERPLMPGTMILECLVQLADLVVREESRFEQLGMLAGLDSLKLYQVVRPGDQLKLEVQLSGGSGDQTKVGGRAAVGDQKVALATFFLMRCPLEKYERKTEAQRIFRLLSQGAGAGSAS